MATWESVQDQKVLTQRKQEMLVYNDRTYVLERKYTGLKWLAEYFRCVNGCADCKARVVRKTPVDGSPPYVESSEMHAHHHAACNPNAQAILIRKAKQELVEIVVKSSAAGGATQSIRDNFDSVNRIVHHNAGVVSFILFTSFINLLFLFALITFN